MWGLHFTNDCMWNGLLPLIKSHLFCLDSMEIAAIFFFLKHERDGFVFYLKVNNSEVRQWEQSHSIFSLSLEQTAASDFIDWRVSSNNEAVYTWKPCQRLTHTSLLTVTVLLHESTLSVFRDKLVILCTSWCPTVFSHLMVFCVKPLDICEFSQQSFIVACSDWLRLLLYI